MHVSLYITYAWCLDAQISIHAVMLTIIMFSSLDESETSDKITNDTAFVTI